MSTIVTNVKKIDNNTTLYIVATTTTFCLLNKITRRTRIIHIHTRQDGMRRSSARCRTNKNNNNNNNNRQQR